MAKRILFFAFLSLALILGLVGPARADAPQTTECLIPWFTSEGEYIEFPVEGQLVTNGQGFNLRCPLTIDLGDPGLATIEQVCQDILGPDLCSGSGNSIHIHNGVPIWLYYDDEWVELTDFNYQVNVNGQSLLSAQYAPSQCANEQHGYSWTLEFPAGYWTPGIHHYTLNRVNPIFGDVEIYEINFTVDADAPLLHSQVRLGPGGLYPIDVIHPAQDTFMQMTYALPVAYAGWLEFFRDSDIVNFSWDGGPETSVQAGPIRNFCAERSSGWMQRTYGFVR